MGYGGAPMTLGTILLIIVILLLVGAFPTYPYSRSWGYRPAGGVGVVLVIIILLLLFGVL
jgi:Protein of unknown function (DUF3309)